MSFTATSCTLLIHSQVGFTVDVDGPEGARYLQPHQLQVTLDCSGHVSISREVREDEWQVVTTGTLSGKHLTLLDVIGGLDLVELQRQLAAVAPLVITHP